MKVVVDFDVCASTGTCTNVAPEVFEIRADGYLYLLGTGDPDTPEGFVGYDTLLPEGLVAKAQEAADLCPTGAISIVDDEEADAGEGPDVA